MRANEYGASWHTEVDKFYRADKETSVDYLHSVDAKYDFKNNLLLEAASGQSEGYVDWYFAKAGYKFDLGGNPLTISYQSYDARDKADDRTVDDTYNGTA